MHRQGYSVGMNSSEDRLKNLDPETRLAYLAEQSIPVAPILGSFDEAVNFARRVIGSPLWNSYVGEGQRVSILSAPVEGRESYFERNRPYVWTSGKLGIHPEMLWPLNILHELAHGAAPHYRYVAGACERTGMPKHLHRHPHGPIWRAVLLQFAELFAPENAADLSIAYRAHGLEVSSSGELDEARAESARAEEEMVAWEVENKHSGHDGAERGVLEHQYDSVGVPLSYKPAAAMLLPFLGLRIETCVIEYLMMADSFLAAAEPVLVCSRSYLFDLLRVECVSSLDFKQHQIMLAILVYAGVHPAMMRGPLGICFDHRELEAFGWRQLNDSWFDEAAALMELESYRSGKTL